MRTVLAILYHDALRLTVCALFGHRDREIDLGYHGTALSCGTCLDFRYPGAGPRSAGQP